MPLPAGACSASRGGGGGVTPGGAALAARVDGAPTASQSFLAILHLVRRRLPRRPRRPSDPDRQSHRPGLRRLSSHDQRSPLPPRAAPRRRPGRASSTPTSSHRCSRSSPAGTALSRLSRLTLAERLPRDRSVEGPHLERLRAVAKAHQPAHVGGGQRAVGQRHEAVGGHVAQDAACVHPVRRPAPPSGEGQPTA